MQPINAQETIEQLKIADWPNMKKEARNRFYNSLNKQASPSILKEERKPLSAEHLAAILNRG